MSNLTELISTTEAIAVLGVDRSTLSRWVKFGDVRPAQRLNGPRSPMLFRRADIEKLRKAREAA